MPGTAEFRLQVTVDFPPDVVQMLGHMAGMVNEDTVREPLVEGRDREIGLAF